MSNKKKTVELYCPRCDHKFSVEITEKQLSHELTRNQSSYIEVRCPICMSSHVYEYGKVKSTLYVEGSNADEVNRVVTSLMQENEKHLGSKYVQNPWISGSFYLAALLSISALFLVIARQLHPLIFPLVLIGSIIAVSVIGAFQLRQDQSLSEKNFLSLMALTFRQLPLNRKKNDDNNSKKLP